jgi:hypothetical protein
MVIEVDLQKETARLTGAHDFTRFHLEVHGGRDPSRLDAVLLSTETGAVETPADAIVRVDAVRRMAGDTDSRWEEDFVSMLDFARTSGWLIDDGSAIRAHIEWD